MEEIIIIVFFVIVTKFYELVLKVEVGTNGRWSFPIFLSHLSVIFLIVHRIFLETTMWSMPREAWRVNRRIRGTLPSGLSVGNRSTGVYAAVIQRNRCW